VESLRNPSVRRRQVAAGRYADGNRIENGLQTCFLFYYAQPVALDAQGGGVPENLSPKTTPPVVNKRGRNGTSPGFFAFNRRPVQRLKGSHHAPARLDDN